MLNILTLGSEAEHSLQQTRGLLAEASRGFHHQTSEHARVSAELLVVLAVLVDIAVGVSRVLGPHPKNGERAGDSHINSQWPASAPIGQSHITRARLGIGEDVPHLDDGREQTLQQVPNTIVSHNVIPVPSAAGGVIAKFIDCLQRGQACRRPVAS